MRGPLAKINFDGICLTANDVILHASPADKKGDQQQF